jgi:hypothetical protein
VKHCVLFLALAGAMTLTGCSNLVSLSPIVTDDQAVMDPALLGIWASQDEKDIYWVSQEGTTYSIRHVDDSGASQEFKARLKVAGDFKLVDLFSAEDDPFHVAVHTPVRIWTEGNTVRLATMDSDWIKDQATQQLLTTPVKDRCLITTAGEAAGSFIAKLGADPRASGDPELVHRLQ